MTVDKIKNKNGWQGKRMTRQRRMVYENLLNRDDHPDVEGLYEDVRSQIPKLSLQTVYRTVGLFEALSMVRRVAMHKGRIRYDAYMTPHSHFLCEDCGAVMDVDSPDIPWLAIVCRAGRLGAIQSGEVLFKGTCHVCLEEPEAKQLLDVGLDVRL